MDAFVSPQIVSSQWTMKLSGPKCLSSVERMLKPHPVGHSPGRQQPMMVLCCPRSIPSKFFVQLEGLPEDELVRILEANISNRTASYGHAIQVMDLSVYYGSFRAIKNVSLNIQWYTYL